MAGGALRGARRYKPKNATALKIALGGLPNGMRVEVDPDVEVLANRMASCGWQLLVREVGGGDTSGTLSRKRRKGEPGKRTGPGYAETVGSRF